MSSRHQFDNALSIKGDQSAKIVRIGSQNRCTKMGFGIGANHTAKNWPRRLDETLHLKMRRMVRVGLTVGASPANVAPFESWAHQNQPAVHFLSNAQRQPRTLRQRFSETKKGTHEMPPTSRKVLSHLPPDGEFEISPSAIGRIIGTHHANVRRALRNLVASGTLAIIDEPQRPHNAPGHYRGATR